MTLRTAARRRAVALLWTLAISLLAATASAAPFEVNDATWEGCAEFLGLARKELGKDRVVVLSTLDWEQLKAGDGIIVLHPERPIDAEEAAAFMKAGGRMAVVDDYGKGDALLSHFKIRRRSLPAQPLNYLRNKPSLPVATPAFDASGGEVLGLHPTVADVKQVVLNHGTGLRHPDLTPVLEVRASGGQSVTVAVAGQIDGPQAKGRLFAMGDPSAFINMMLRYPGNRAFAVGLVHYLADGDATEKRSGRLFVVANEFGEKGSFGGVTPLRKSIDRKIEALVEALDELRQEGFPWWLHMLVAAATALAVLWWVMRSLVRMYQSRLPRFARAIPLVAQGGVAGRVAVLSSKSSPPALALLEVRSALVEALAAHLDMSAQTPPSLLFDALSRRGQMPEDLEPRARNMLGTMSAAETAVVAGTPARVTDEEVGAAAAIVERIVAHAQVEIPWPPTFIDGDVNTGN